MPSIEQCEATSGSVAALPSTLEIFDKFKSASENGKDSDSEESFHLPLDDDDMENQSVVSNGREKEIQNEETEDDILNKFETVPAGTPDNIDPHIEDSILNDVDNSTNDSEKFVERNSKDGVKSTPSERADNAEEHTKVQVKITYDAAEYEDSADGEFKSVYEADQVTAKDVEPMEVGDGDDDESEKTDSDVNKDSKSVESSRRATGGNMEFEQEDVAESDRKMEDSDVSMEDEAVENHSGGAEVKDVEMAGEGQAEENVEPFRKRADGPKESEKTKLPASEEDESSQEAKSEKLQRKELGQSVKAKNDEKEIFKAPEKVSKRQSTEDPDLQNEKSNEDESDLLDVSMIREAEEDDACAIADALDDKEAQASEKSDEEQSEKVETEQENSDFDKDNEDNDIEQTDFEDADEDSRTDDDSSIAESGKVVSISETSKDSVADSDTKKAKKPVDVESDISSDVTITPASEETDVSTSITPDKSLNLDSSAVADDTTVTSEADSSRKQVIDNNKRADGDKTVRDSENAKLIESRPASETPSEEVDVTERKKHSLNKRPLSQNDVTDEELSAKKPKLASALPTEIIEKETVDKSSVANQDHNSTNESDVVNEKIKTLTGFTKFMQCRKFTAKLSRSDLEQFCIQKICESLMLKSSEGELHQTIKKHEKTIDQLRKDVQQLSKQCKDLEIVNKKLMNELRNPNSLKKPLVPLKITRSVGLQVRLNPGNENANQNRRRQTTNSTTTPQKQIVNNSPAVRNKVVQGSAPQTPVVRQVLQNSPAKSALTSGQTTTAATTAPTTALLSQALQQAKPIRSQVIAAKKTSTPVRKPEIATKPPSSNPGVIDLTDEDDRLAAAKMLGNTIIKKTVPASNKTVGKVLQGKATATNQGKQIHKTVTVGSNKTSLPQGIRLTPASVITSSANGSPQMLYVVPTITSNAGGTQKVTFVNFQPTNGVISGTLNGSPVSVMSNNKGPTLTLKTVPSVIRHKHPAPLPPPPRAVLDPKLKPLLPKPHLTIKKIDSGIILQWKMPYNLDFYENIASYQLYAYQETSAPPNTDMWRKVGDVKALALPMACTLTQFADKNKYYFAVRSVDVHKRIGAFSDPEEISL